MGPLTPMARMEVDCTRCSPGGFILLGSFSSFRARSNEERMKCRCSQLILGMNSSVFVSEPYTEPTASVGYAVRYQGLVS